MFVLTLSCVYVCVCWFGAGTQQLRRGVNASAVSAGVQFLSVLFAGRNVERKVSQFDE